MKYSILNPNGKETEFKELSEVTLHDLGFDQLVGEISKKEVEQRLLLRVLSQLTKDPEVARYRAEVFEDLYAHGKMREELMEILEKINFLRDYGSFKREYDESAGAWDLLHRLDELKDYIACVEAIESCLKAEDIKSEGLKGLRDYVGEIYRDNGFGELKKDIEALRATTTNLKSITVGINLNDRFEADGIGIISINDRPFTSAGIIGNLANLISTKDKIHTGNEWDGDYKFSEFSVTADKMADSLDQATRLALLKTNPIVGVAGVPRGDTTQDITRYMDRVVNHMISSSVKTVRQVLNKYVSITITDITDLIPEFLYYIRFAEYIERLEQNGAKFCKACVLNSEQEAWTVRARGIYNLKLAAFAGQTSEEIITNDLDFDRENLVYILTGANRGGKTTITQAIGQLFVLAQGGIFVPGDSFEYCTVDCIYTHFPADEDKTMDLGRLGEECKRFREIYGDASADSLLLLNETFSTTSFEEGYFIARDAVKAILNKGIRTIYNTHMHKLAFDIEEMNRETTGGKARSLIVESQEGKRSYKIKVAPPVGRSFAKDIAEKYGVTYEMLTGVTS